jgi:hypothetical protein
MVKILAIPSSLLALHAFSMSDIVAGVIEANDKAHLCFL